MAWPSKTITMSIAAVTYLFPSERLGGNDMRQADWPDGLRKCGAPPRYVLHKTVTIQLRKHASIATSQGHSVARPARSPVGTDRRRSLPFPCVSRGACRRGERVFATREYPDVPEDKSSRYPLVGRNWSPSPTQAAPPRSLLLHAVHTRIAHGGAAQHTGRCAVDNLLAACNLPCTRRDCASHSPLHRHLPQRRRQSGTRRGWGMH